MGDFITTFHIDWKLLIAQVINLTVAIGVLWTIVLKPLMKTMRARTEEIEKGLNDAKEIERRLTEVERDKEKILQEARREAQSVVEQSMQAAEKVRQDKLAETRQEIERLAEKARQDLQADQAQAMQEARAHIADLVVMATETLLQKHIDPESNRQIIEETVRRAEPSAK